MATKRLSDLDGTLKKAAFGTEIIGDGSTAIPSDGYYLVTAVAGSSELLGATVGYLVYLTTAITPATGDNVKPVTFTDLCAVQNASAEFTKDELETTTLCDAQKVYTTGRADLTGSFDGVAIAGSDEYLEIANKFIATNVQESGAVTISEANNNIFYLYLETFAGSAADSIRSQAYIFPTVLNNFSAGVTQGSAQTFSSGFRITNDGVNGVVAALMEREV